jgi:hypothetical protein
MRFSQLATYLNQLEEISARLEITKILAELLLKLPADEIIPASYLLQGTLVPAYQSLEFQLSTKMVQRALARLVKAEMVDRLAPQPVSLFEIEDQATANNGTNDDDPGRLKLVESLF